MRIKSNSYFENSIVIGTGKFAFQCSKYLKELNGLNGVYEYGNYRQSQLEMLCKKNNFFYVKLLDSLACDNLMMEIEKSRKKTLIVSASNIYIFPKFVTENPNVTIINYHRGLFSKHLGRNAEAWAIFCQDPVAGVTWHKVTSQIDHGEILAEQCIPLTEDITSIQLMLRQYQVGFELFKELIRKMNLRGSNSNDQNGTYGQMHYSYERPNDGILNLDTMSGGSIRLFEKHGLRCPEYAREPCDY